LRTNQPWQLAKPTTHQGQNTMLNAPTQLQETRTDKPSLIVVERTVLELLLRKFIEDDSNQEALVQENIDFVLANTPQKMLHRFSEDECEAIALIREPITDALSKLHPHFYHRQLSLIRAILAETKSALVK
jgi:hypothetical protein